MRGDAEQPRRVGDALAVVAGRGGDGRLDAPRPQELHELLRSLDAQAEFVVVPGAGHWVQYEAADSFNGALDKILKAGRMRR